MGKLEEIEQAIEQSESPNAEERQTIDAHKRIIAALIAYLGEGAERVRLSGDEPKVYLEDPFTSIDKSGVVKSTIGVSLSRLAMEFDVYTGRNPTNSGSGADALVWLVSLPKAQVTVELYDNLVRIDKFFTSVGNFIERAARANARR